jgi:hypothetical protein
MCSYEHPCDTCLIVVGKPRLRWQSRNDDRFTHAMFTIFPVGQL